MASSDRHFLLSRLRPGGGGALRWLGHCGYRVLRRTAFALSLSDDQGAVVFAGDSIIDQWTTLEGDFPRLKAVNRGISGDTSRELLFRLPKDVLACHPSAVVILIGTNDLAANVPPRRIAAFIRRMADKIERFGGDIPVVLCRVLPRAKAPGLFPEKILELNGFIDRLAAGREHVSACDAFTPLASEDGSCREDSFVDGLHLNASGYDTLAKVLNPVLPRPD